MGYKEVFSFIRVGECAKYIIILLNGNAIIDPNFLDSLCIMKFRAHLWLYFIKTDNGNFIFTKHLT